jgi:hypothetical protein
VSIFRNVASVIVGAASMFVIVFVAQLVLSRLLGIERIHEPGVWEPSTLWIVLSFIVGQVGAALGGYNCALIAPPGSKAPIVFAVLVLIAGLLLAIPAARDPSAQPQPRPPDATFRDMMQAVQENPPPAWVAFLNPIIGSAGVLLGASLRRRPATPP